MAFSFRNSSIESLQISEELLMPNSLRGSFQVEGEYLQFPFYGHRSGRIAYPLVAGLIPQIAGDGDSPLLGKHRAQTIGNARWRHGEILADPKLSLEDRDMFLDCFQVEYFRARVNDRLEFDSWTPLQDELNRLIALHPGRIDVHIGRKLDFGNQADSATWYDTAIGLCKGKLEVRRRDILRHLRAQLREEFRN